MKKTLLFVTLISLFVITNCKKDDDDNNNDKNCTKAPEVNAGKDSTVINGTIFKLNTITNADNAIWSIIEGQGGTIDSTSGSINFTGAAESEYKLKLVSENDCGISADTVKIKFVKDCSAATSGSAGNDITVYNVVKAKLNATAVNGTGEWKVVSGTGATLSDNKSTQAEISGRAGIAYSLQWTVTGNCKTIVDTVIVKFEVVMANAGNDILIYNDDSAQLKGSLSKGTGEWSILSGSGGNLIKPSQGNTYFTGAANTTYQLVWTVTYNSVVAKDTISVQFKQKDCGSDMTVDQMVQNIHWITQSCFRIEGSSFKIYIDPQGITKKDEADIILITHNHGDHYAPNDIDLLSGPKTIIIAPANCDYSGVFGKRVVMDLNTKRVESGCITVEAVSAYNIVKSFHAHDATSVGYIITVNGVKIYHAGDTERIPEMKNYKCDIAMLPLGQTYTMNSLQDAVDAAKDINPKVVIPMHYGGPEGIDANATTFKTMLDGTLNVVIKTRGQ